MIDLRCPLCLCHLKGKESDRTAAQDHDKILRLHPRPFQDPVNSDGYGFHDGGLFKGDALGYPVKEPGRDIHIFCKPSVDSPSQGPLGRADVLLPGEAESAMTADQTMNLRDDAVSLLPALNPGPTLQPLYRRIRDPGRPEENRDGHRYRS